MGDTPPEIATEAIILAGGLGTRLRSAVPDLPKPMAPVGGRPFLAYVLDELVRSGVEAAVLAVGFRHEAIRAHFGERYRNLALRYSVESKPLGTGGAIRLACGQISGEEVFVLNGDTYLRADYRAMLNAHRSAAARLTIAAYRVQDTARYGALEIAGRVVRGFREKGRSGPGWINAGTYILGRALRESLPRRGAFSFEQDVLVPEVGLLCPLVFEADGPFIDIGVPNDYAHAQEVLGGARGATP